MRMSNLETITVVYDLPAAVCLKSALESQGIAVFVDGLHHASVDWWVTIALGGMRVRVIDRDAAMARDYLRRVESEGEPPPSPASDIWKRPVVNGILIPFGLFLGSVPLWVRPRPGGQRGPDPPPQDLPDRSPEATGG